jgi:hypothetical protein
MYTSHTLLLLLITETIAQFTIKLNRTAGFLQYAVPVQVGAVQLNLAIDTTDPYHVLYNSAPSSALRTALTLPPRVLVARNEEQGPILSDRFTLGSASVAGIPFTAVSSASPFNGVQGVLGLGHPLDSNSSFLQSMVDQRQIPSMKFGYCIDTSTEFANLDLGYFTHPGPFEFVRAIAPTWRSIVNATNDEAGVSVPHGIPISTVSFGTYTSTIENMIGYVHTNIGLTHLPRPIFDAIATQVSATPTTGSFYNVDCNAISRFPELTLRLGTATLKWVGNEYTLKRADGSCFLAFTPYVRPLVHDAAILGTALLRKYYLAFDRSTHQVGFALASTHKGHGEKSVQPGNQTSHAVLPLPWMFCWLLYWFVLQF